MGSHEFTDVIIISLHQCTGIQARLFFSKMMKCFKGKITQSNLFFSAEATRKKWSSFKLLKNAILGQNCSALDSPEDYLRNRRICEINSLLDLILSCLWIIP